MLLHIERQNCKNDTLFHTGVLKLDPLTHPLVGQDLSGCTRYREEKLYLQVFGVDEFLTARVCNYCWEHVVHLSFVSKERLRTNSYSMCQQGLFENMLKYMDLIRP